MAHIFIPPAVRPLVGNRQVIEAQGGNVAELIDDLEQRFPGIRDRLCDRGRIRPGMSVVINGGIATLGLRQTVAAGDEIHFLPSIGGG